MIKLVSTFLNSAGKTHNFTVKNPDTTKSPEEIKESLQLLSSLHLFEKDGVVLFQEVVKAKFVETIEHPIFEGDELFGVPVPEEKPEEIEQPQQLSALHCIWQETPKIPEVSVDLPPIRSEVHDTLRSVVENDGEVKEVTETSCPSIEVTTTLDKEAPLNPPAGSPYDAVKEMIRRRKRRKDKEKERQKRNGPPDTPS
ncbi:DUF2922 family protein [Enterococcus pallens]|uniref:DUF2922 family protein n=1 Tax=Enterococcus pallens ATCC BAA-351 TaxID=1158607 RepID=R2SS02_9ENTE|nr:DUF2922 family protein [Enterococcus pallens]EOH95596.1 hypothetical protein UAU_01558 [Enterococcus pallens ATCC BAA-351]EOU21267.1 hypothetical protein I588_02114 [Enterococcus pallens ATCC BAA-351]OJG75648.1 hypothetical protein RV10_GL004507 [Enterococcus pallens]